MKKILISQRIVEEAKSQEIRDCLDVAWGSLLSQYQLLSIPVASGCHVSSLFKELTPDGVILTGGNDLSSVSKNTLNDLRDKIDSKLLEEALRSRIPILGVCRGMQSIAQHFDFAVKELPGHVATEHSIYWQKTPQWISEDMLPRKVNSFHNYGIFGGSPDFDILAKSDDQGIEMFIHKTLPVCGMMWHPERKGAPEEFDRLLFETHFKR